MKNILIAVAGSTPAVITETIYYMLVHKNISFDEVYVITTTHGESKIKEHIYKKSTIYKMYEDYGKDLSKAPVPKPKIIIDDKGKPLYDVRTEKQNIAAAKTIVDFVRKKAADPDCALHCSIAGGRKTMSSYLALAMNFFGREQDTLSHVLVSPEKYEDPKCEFFYPTPANDEAEVELAEIPFIRLRNSLEKAYGTTTLDFDLLMKITHYTPDEWYKEVNTQFDVDSKTLTVEWPGQSIDIEIPPKEAAIYLTLYQSENPVSVAESQKMIMNYKKFSERPVKKDSFYPDKLIKDISHFNKSTISAIPAFIIPHIEMAQTDEKSENRYTIRLPIEKRKLVS